jgi:hypothetical protein
VIDIGKPRERRGREALEVGSGKHAAHDRSDIASHHADERAEKFGRPLRPDVQSDHREKSDCSNAQVRRARRRRGSGAEQAAEPESSNGHADHHDDEAGNLRRKERPQRTEQSRHRNLHQAGEDRHAEHERQAARLQREYRWRQVRRGEDRRTQIPRTDAASTELLQHRSDRHHEHRQ